jgi:hypothetical protein
MQQYPNVWSGASEGMKDAMQIDSSLQKRKSNDQRMALTDLELSRAKAEYQKYEEKENEDTKLRTIDTLAPQLKKGTETYNNVIKFGKERGVLEEKDGQIVSTKRKLQTFMQDIKNADEFQSVLNKSLLKENASAQQDAEVKIAEMTEKFGVDEEGNPKLKSDKDKEEYKALSDKRMKAIKGIEGLLNSDEAWQIKKLELQKAQEMKNADFKKAMMQEKYRADRAESTARTSAEARKETARISAGGRVKAAEIGAAKETPAKSKLTNVKDAIEENYSDKLPKDRKAEVAAKIDRKSVV